MTTKLFWCVLGGVLIAGFLASPAMAGTTFIDFNPELGHLANDQSPPGVLANSGNKGVFSSAGTAFLNDGMRIVASNQVSITIKLNPVSDAFGAEMCMFIADRDFPADAVTACFNGDAHPSTGDLNSPWVNGVSLGISFPAATDDFTLLYEPGQDKATLSRASGGTPVSIFGALNGVQNFVIGLTTSGGGVQLRQFTAAGDDIPDYPSMGDPLDPDNPWVNFGLTRGTGAESDPFDTLTEALAAANPDATIHIIPQTDSPETFTGGNEINQSVTLVNSNPSGEFGVQIGVPSRRESGFVSRSGSFRRR